MPLSLSPRSSIIIPVFNKVSYTQGCVESLLSVDEASTFEIIIIDNGSVDGTSEYLAALTAQLGEACRVITLPENRGYAEANNLGAAAARGEYLVLLNNDTLLSPHWLTNLLRMAQRQRVGVVGPKLVYPDNDTINHAGYAYNSERALFYAIYANQPMNLPHLNRALEVQALLGAALLVPAGVYREVGGMHHLGLEDIDFCLRVRKAGYRVIYAPESLVYHYGSVTVLGSPAGSIPTVSHHEFSERWPKSELVGDDLQRYERDGYSLDGIGENQVNVQELLIDVYNHLAATYQCLKRHAYSEAEQELQKALERHPRNAEVWCELLSLPRMNQDNEASLQMARLAVERASHSVEVLLGAARTVARYAKKHQCGTATQEAQGLYTRIIEHDLFPELEREVAAIELAALQILPKSSA